MPVTAPAHQACVLPIKRRWPGRVDGTALLVGSAMPDLADAVAYDLGVHSHEWSGFPLDVALGLVMVWLIRRWIAPVWPSIAPDLGPFRTHSWAVVATRHPTRWQAFAGVTIGVLTHVVLDSFTHDGRLLATWLGYSHHVVTLLGMTRTTASWLQWAGHLLGSLGAIWLIYLVGRRRELERWYSPRLVAIARARRLTDRQRRTVLTALFCGLAIGAAVAPFGVYGAVRNRPVVGAIVGLAIGGRLALGPGRTAGAPRSTA